MKKFSLTDWLTWAGEGPVRPGEDGSARWFSDPLSHPDIEAMSERELADLPFARGRPQAVDRSTCC